MSTNAPDNDITLTKPLPIGIAIPETLPIDKEGRTAANEYIEQRFEAAMQRRRDFIHQFEQETGMELDATRRDSVLEAEHPNSLAQANHGAIKLLLEAWYERVGIQDAGWTRYNEKNTPRACKMIREILEKGDEEMGIPISALQDKDQWTKRMASLKFWFFSLSTAFDFLAAYGIGTTKFGCGMVRVEILKYSVQNGRCLSGSDHDASMTAWNEGETKPMPGRWPPIKPCGCYEYKLLVRTVANARKIATTGDANKMRVVADWLSQDWLVANKDADFGGAQEWPTDPRGSKPARIVLGEEPFNVWFYKESDLERGFSLTAVRVEGRLGQLL